MKQYANLEYVAVDRATGKRSYVRFGRRLSDGDDDAERLRWARSVGA